MALQYSSRNNTRATTRQVSDSRDSDLGATADGGLSDVGQHCHATLNPDTQVADDWCRRNDTAAHDERLCGQLTQ
jgi:hypothetical protein